MKIRTIVERLDHNNTFDTKVNEAISEGFTLVKREVLQAYSTAHYRMLYAELVKNPTEQTHKNGIGYLGGQ